MVWIKERLSTSSRSSSFVDLLFDIICGTVKLNVTTWLFQVLVSDGDLPVSSTPVRYSERDTISLKRLNGSVNKWFHSGIKPLSKWLKGSDLMKLLEMKRPVISK